MSLIIKTIYHLSPFNLSGDLSKRLTDAKGNFISCLICSARKSSFIEQLLTDLSQQNLEKDQFEIIILDNSLDGLEKSIKKYTELIPIKCVRNTSTDGNLGHFKNELLSKAQGSYILFLDDDTRLLQKDFLKKTLYLFKQFDPDILLPYGKPLICPDIPHYKFLDPYSLATRCCVYKRSILETMGGFRGSITAYEDIELGIRCSLWGAKILKTTKLEYHHPSLFFNSLQKPLAIGQSILKLKDHYPWHVWILIYLNALRFFPFILIPTIKNRQWFKISLGVLIAPWIKKRYTY